MKKVSVSVVIPTLNGLLKSDEVLLSLERQSRIDAISEVIIIDDASTIPRKTELYEAKIKKFSRLHIVVLYHKKNRGPAAARNTGIKMAKGDIVFFTDDDCELPASWIDEHLEAYKCHPTVSSVGGWYRPYRREILNNVFQLYQEILYKDTYGNLLQSPWDSRAISGLSFPAINTANLSVRKHVFSRVMFDEDFIAPGYEDMFFSESIRRAGYIMYYIPQFVFHHKNLNLRGFIKLFMNRGMGKYVYLEKYGMKRKSFFAKYSVINLIRKLSLQSAHIRKKKLQLLFLDCVRYFLVHSSIMQYYYGRKYIKRMNYYPRLFFKVLQQ